jgi:aldose 1-epimerase
VIRTHSIQNKHLTRLVVSNYGAIVTELHVADRDGKLDDIALGLNSPEAYLDNPNYFGAAIGPLAGRTSPTEVDIDGRSYRLTPNEGANHLHGGDKGLDKRYYEVESTETPEGPTLILTTHLKDGEEGYPGNRTVTIRYSLTHNNTFRVESSMETDAATLFDPTHHTYFNLGGHDSGFIGEHTLTIPADTFVPIDESFMPMDNEESLDGKWFDFRKPTKIATCLDPDERGICYPYILKREDSEAMVTAAILDHPESGRRLTVRTNQNTLNCYSGYFLNPDLPAKGGAAYQPHGAICLETQNFANGINVSARPSSILHPGKTKTLVTDYQFSTQPNKQRI